ncbi:MAG TPA: Ca2+-dependent phosphoinositide-specific phospholipase C [Labilithrix sp.]|nr:Ca2+-dependent phosphoinositide-specific phospholipase C [Labilithrix sp.]
MRLRRCVPLLALLGGCSTTAEPGPTTGPVAHPRTEHGYPMDDVLRMNHVQVRATHNSYHVETAGSTLAEWHYTHAPLDVQLDTQGVRALELDTHFMDESGRFEVFHIAGLDEQTTCRAFTECLAVVRRWSDAHPGHEPLSIQIEPKDAPPADAEPYFAELEREILAAWPRERIVAPDDVQRAAASLREAVTTAGWPLLGETRGTVLFYVDNHDSWRDAYSHGLTTLAGRLMFVDAPSDSPLAAVVIANDPTDRSTIDAAARAGFLVRTRADEAGLPEQRAAALATGAHLLSSDFPSAFQLPGGTPSRCNPLTAPAGCTPSAVEDPAHLR